MDAHDTALALHDLGDLQGYRRGCRIAGRANEAYAQLLREIAKLVQSEIGMAESMCRLWPSVHKRGRAPRANSGAHAVDRTVISPRLGGTANGVPFMPLNRGGSGARTPSVGCGRSRLRWNA
jgi:hypothetical protein